MSVVSSSDLWMFASSRGTLTAGRIDADNAFLPYETDDRIHRAVGVSGPITIIASTIEGRRRLWRPFGTDIGEGIRRSLAKSVLGDRLMFEETNPDWGLVYRATWRPAPSFGWVRTVEITETGGSARDLEVLDGLLDVNPFGVAADVEQERSNLVDAYKRSETGRWGTAAIYTLESLITDQAEPAEALGATVIWSQGDLSEVLLDERAVQAMIDGIAPPTGDQLLGRRGAYLLRGNISLAERGSASWALVADSGLDHGEVLHRTRVAGLVGGLEAVRRDEDAGSERLRSLLAGADGFQGTGDPIADAHHLSNVLFNVMRGGLLEHGHRVPVPDLLDHLRRWNRLVWERHAATIGGLGEWVEAEDVRRAAIATGDPHLIRLVLEFLPLAFSRRHGDPSRPWNRFSIRVGDDSEDLFAYEGNWRDIFQNWEALMMSHPEFLSHVVAKFVNASTTDGHNPYRITQDGIDWEIPDPHDPWSNIGYWGDHQIVYLHRLLELWERMDPGGVVSWLDRRVFAYADVPYAIAGHEDMVRDPRNTITFEWEREEAVGKRVDSIGADGRLVVGANGEIVMVTLIEKLLVPVLAKLSSFVPGGGIWMNTQRPEWNDANNALAGFGLSMVTLYYLRGYLEMLRQDLVPQLENEVVFSAAVARWVTDLTDVLQRFLSDDCHADAGLRRAMVDELGASSERYRKSSRESFDSTPVGVAASAVSSLIEAAIEHLDRSIEVGRRSDGLFDSYNVVSFPNADEAVVGHLGPMLEGQVAVLSSGALGAGRAVGVIEALYESAMYREDQDTFMLYPVRVLPAFLDQNTIPADDPVIAPLASELTGLDGVLVQDDDGGLHFSPAMINADAVAEALHLTTLDSSQRSAVLDRYEAIFGHHEYTGRSGSMYGYEGIGSVYWHMVGKLLVAVQETYWRAADDGSKHADALAHAYRRIRAGLGFCKDPVTYGAIPTDCYSHTPSHSGAQQPGMTGQVKEEIITRFGELGLRVNGGVISLEPGLLEIDQLVPVGSHAEFSYCGTRFAIKLGSSAETRASRSGTWSEPVPGLALSPEVSLEVLGRSGSVDSVEFTIARH
jgi:hypothetical protein